MLFLAEFTAESVMPWTRKKPPASPPISVGHESENTPQKRVDFLLKGLNANLKRTNRTRKRRDMIIALANLEQLLREIICTTLAK